MKIHARCQKIVIIIVFGQQLTNTAVFLLFLMINNCLYIFTFLRDGWSYLTQFFIIKNEFDLGGTVTLLQQDHPD